MNRAWIASEQVKKGVTKPVDPQPEEQLTQEQKNAAHEAIRFLAERCNGANTLDGQGFNKIDTAIGKSLATAPYLTNKQAILARKIALKYKLQLGEQLSLGLA